MESYGFFDSLKKKLIKLQDADLSKYKGYETDSAPAETTELKTPPTTPALVQPEKPIAKPVQIDPARVQKNYDGIFAVMKGIYDNAVEFDEEFSVPAKIKQKLMQQKQNVQKLPDPTKTEILSAINKFEKDFEQKGLTLFSSDKYVTFVAKEQQPETEPVELEAPEATKTPLYPDLTELEVKNLIQVNAKAFRGRSQNATARAIEYLRSLNQFKMNTHNMDILDSLVEAGVGQHFALQKSPMSKSQRVDLISLFEQHYLRDVGEKEKEANMKKLFGDTIETEFDDDEKTMPTDYIRDHIFQSKGNKEFFLNFFVENDGNPRVQAILQSIAEKYKVGMIGEYEDFYGVPFAAQAPDEDAQQQKDMINKNVRDWATFIEFSKNRSDYKIFNFMQSGMFDYFYDEVKNIIVQHDHPLHMQFFNWVASQIKDLTLVSEYAPKAFEEGQYVDENREEQGEEEITTKELGQATKAVLQSNDLNTCNLPKIRLGDFVSPKYIECLRQDWKKLDSYMKDLLQNMNAEYNLIDPADRTKGTSDRREFLLSKLLLWEKMYESMTLAVGDIIGNKERGMKVTDLDIVTLLNRDWSNLLNNLSFASVDMSQFDTTVVKYVEKASEDLQISSDEAYEKLLGKGMKEWGSNREALIRMRNSAHQQLAKTNPQFARLLQEYKADSTRVETAFRGLDPSNFAKIDKLRKDNDNKLKGLFEKAQTNLADLEHLIAPSDLVGKYGADTVLTFLEVLIKEPEVVEVGVLLSRQNPGTYTDKLNYIYDLMNRGLSFEIDDANLQKLDAKTLQTLQDKRAITEDKLDDLTPQQIDSVFNTVRDILLTMHLPARESKRFFAEEAALDDRMIQEIVTELQEKHESKFPVIKNIAELRAAKKEVRNEFYEHMLQSRFGKYYIEATTNYNALVSWVAKGLQAICMDSDRLAQVGFADADSFMKSIGIETANVDLLATKKSDIESAWYAICEQLNDLEPRKVKSIAKRYLPETFDVYANIRRLQKGGVKNTIEATTMQSVFDYMRSAREAGAVPPDPKRVERSMGNAQFLGRMLDLSAQKRTKQAKSQKPTKQASIVYFTLL